MRDDVGRARSRATLLVALADWIAAWHGDSDPLNRPLHAWLGWTWDEYREWIERGELPKRELQTGT